VGVALVLFLSLAAFAMLKISEPELKVTKEEMALIVMVCATLIWSVKKLYGCLVKPGDKK